MTPRLRWLIILIFLALSDLAWSARYYRCVDTDGAIYFGDTFQHQSECVAKKVNPDSNLLSSPRQPSTGFAADSVLPADDATQEQCAGWNFATARVVFKEVRRGADPAIFKEVLLEHKKCLSNVSMAIKRGRTIEASLQASICNQLMNSVEPPRIVKLPATIRCESIADCRASEHCIKGDQSSVGICGSIETDAPRPFDCPNGVLGMPCESDSNCEIAGDFKCRKTKNASEKLCLRFRP